jgi:hypothetical protein
MRSDVLACADDVAAHGCLCVDTVRRSKRATQPADARIAAAVLGPKHAASLIVMHATACDQLASQCITHASCRPLLHDLYYPPPTPITSIAPVELACTKHTSADCHMTACVNHFVLLHVTLLLQ